MEPSDKKELGIVLNTLKIIVREKFKTLVEQIRTAGQTTEQPTEDLTLPPPANAHDSQHLEATLRKVRLPQRSRVLADKGYCAKKPMRRCSIVRTCVTAYSAKPTEIGP